MRLIQEPGQRANGAPEDGTDISSSEPTNEKEENRASTPSDTTNLTTGSNSNEIKPRNDIPGEQRRQQRIITLLLRVLRWLKPLNNSAQEIQALDGVRAIAALSIVLFHSLLFIVFEATPLSKAMNHAWYYLSTGVQLFFVLSGFLLFMPYARAMLLGRPLPSILRFYQRRALRILPAYWVCLSILLWLKRDDPRTFLPDNLISHYLLIQDAFPRFNRAINGPFWTLAVEAQFYLLLPLFCWGIAALVGKSRSLGRIALGIAILITLAMALRTLDLYIVGTLPTNGALADKTFGQAFVVITMGSQGKFIEVFAVGMLCNALYVASVEGKFLSLHATRRLSWSLFAFALAMIWICSQRVDISDVLYKSGYHWGYDADFYSLFVGLGYGGLVLAAVWGGRLLQAPFSAPPLRFVGLISYSLYMWHLPILHGLPPYLTKAPLWLRLVMVFLISYLSYQLVERPFLQWRRKTHTGEKPLPLPNDAEKGKVQTA